MDETSLRVPRGRVGKSRANFGEKGVLGICRFSLAVRSTLASLEQSAGRSCIFANGMRYGIKVVVLQDLFVFWAPQELRYRVLHARQN